jgi:hypothetical protein
MGHSGELADRFGELPIIGGVEEGRVQPGRRCNAEVARQISPTRITFREEFQERAER